MNPSASGWIKKLQKETSNNDTLLKLPHDSFYEHLRNCGFIYGSNLFVVNNLIDKKDLTNEELSKINLYSSLQYIHFKSGKSINFLESAIAFYKDIKVHKISFFNSIIINNTTSSTLEKIIHKRVQIDDNLLTKNFNYFVINALLYVDVLAYQEYLKKGSISSDYIKKLEASIETIVLETLNTKINKTPHDESLIKLVESSLRYQDHVDISYSEAIKNLNSDHEKWYLLDIACMSTWSDKTIDSKEQSFLQKLGSDLSLDKTTVDESINSVNTFYSNNKDNIALLSSSNIVKNFYDNSSKMVNKLISRNKKRLKKELVQSKQLVKLISQSTIRDLSEEEQKQLQEQLLDIIKAIPSLAIFLLPGGALLLPIFVKFIPKLLPSAFDDNRIEE